MKSITTDNGWIIEAVGGAKPYVWISSGTLYRTHLETKQMAALIKAWRSVASRKKPEAKKRKS